MNDIYDHAPECDVAIWLERAIETDAPRWLGVPDDVACQCQKLRACEARVREEIDREDFVLDEGDPFREAYRAGYSKGVRDAHESASWCQDPDEMLQAIIGLLDMPPPPPLPPSVGVPEKWRP